MISRRGILSLIALTLAGCKKAAPPAPKPNQLRIIVLSPALAITMRDLGLAAHIVGRHGYDFVLDSSLPVCGDQSGLDYEAISRLAPTHVLTQYDSNDVPSRLLSIAKASNFEAINFQLLTLESVRESAQQLALRFGAHSTPINATFEQAFSRRGNGFSEAGRILLLAATNPPGALGPGSFHHQILARIGGIPAVSNGAPFVTLDAEDILRLKPDAIIMVLPRARDAAPMTDVQPDTLISLVPALASMNIPAVTNRKVALIDDPLSQTPSTALIKFADDLAAILGSWHK